MENFLLPSKIEFQAGTNPYSKVLVITPCYHGYGTTLGNALRRVLLSSLPGGAVESFKIKGVQHEFSTVEGISEDVVEVMLNLKQLAVKVFVEEPVVLTLVKKTPGPVTAADITKDSRVEIMNPELLIANLSTTKPFEMEITVANGRGYKPVEEKDRKSYDLGTIVVDSVYTPVKDVGYKVEYTRVGDITNYERLTVSIETNGTITPEEAVTQATQILMNHFSIVLDNIGQAEVKPVQTEAVATTDEASVETEVSEESEEKAAKKKPAKKK